MNRKEFYNTLSDDVKEKIKACKTEDEMLKVLGEEGIALDDELLEGVSGGYGDGCWDHCTEVYRKGTCSCD